LPPPPRGREIGFRKFPARSLHLGWVEEDAIRCVYHGWEFDCSGQCVDQPAEAGQGRIEGRGRERLGRADAGILLWRKILARELRAIPRGGRPRDGKRRPPMWLRRWDSKS